MIKKLKITAAQQAELARIQNSIPAEWQGNVILEKEGFATVKKVLKRIMKDKDASPEAKRKADMALRSGLLDGKVQETEPVAAELVDAYVAKEMLKSVIAKRLPKPKHAPSFATAYKRYQIAKTAYDKKYPPQDR